MPADGRCSISRMRVHWRNPSHLAAMLTGLALSVAAAVHWSAAEGQVFAEGGMEAYESEFYFTRLAYSGGGGGRRWGGAWRIDFPAAEVHLLQGINRLTRVMTGREGRIVSLDNEELMKYPWLYAVEVGNWFLSDTEAALLREYLLRGGFLMVDDFWGTYEWAVFYDSMRRVFPDRPLVDVPESQAGRPDSGCQFDLSGRHMAA
jgi:hypothetical protein